MAGVGGYGQGARPLYGQGPPDPSYGPPDEVRTIFITGFPKDLKERELHNLLRWWPGYEACQMNFKLDQPMGFALFSTNAHAISATDALQNLVFDAESNSVLRAEMAKKNLYTKRGMVNSSGAVDQSKRMRTGENHTPGQFASAYNASNITTSWGTQSYMPLGAVPYEPYGGAVPQHGAQRFSPAGAYVPGQNMKDNPPCNTLFIGNLGENMSENELRGVFSSQPGYRQMKVLRQGKSTVCFIEFMDMNSARHVHDSLQGVVLSSSERGGIRIQYPLIYALLSFQFFLLML